MTVFCGIVFALCLIGECVAVPYFVKFSFPEKSWKSFGVKMTCATLFVIAALCVKRISNNSTEYAEMILWGLAFGWLGDLFLGLNTKKIYITGLGIFAFLAGHIFYIIAFQKAIVTTNPKSTAIAWYEVLVVIALVAAIGFLAYKKNIKLKLYMAIPVAMYAVTISLMLVKALHYCFGEIAYGLYDHPVGMFITVALGAGLFVVSDSTLSLMMFGGEEKNKKLKWTYVVTYFVAQILIGASMFVVYSQH